MKPNKNWFVGVFQCLDHDQMAGSKICMSKDIDLTNSLFSAVHFAPLDGWQKVFKTLDFLFLISLNNIDQLQRSESCIWMSNLGIWVGRIQARNPSRTTQVSLCVCSGNPMRKLGWVRRWERSIWAVELSFGWLTLIFGLINLTFEF